MPFPHGFLPVSQLGATDCHATDTLSSASQSARNTNEIANLWYGNSADTLTQREYLPRQDLAPGSEYIPAGDVTLRHSRPWQPPTTLCAACIGSGRYAHLGIAPCRFCRGTGSMLVEIVQ